jgi:hypothetical protein
MHVMCLKKQIEPAISVHGDVIYFPSGEVRMRQVATRPTYAEHWKELVRKYPAEQSFFVRLQLTGDNDQVRLLSEGRLE